MILSRILKAYTFRFAVLYILTISLTASLISAIVYLSAFYDSINRVQVGGTLVASIFFTMFLGVIGGAVVSAAMIRRIDSLNRSIAAIMQGNLSERLSVSNRGGEIDQLATQLNKMLDRIQNSMNDVREVSDNIAHDLRTPLTRLRNKLSTLNERADDDSRVLIHEMLVESDHLLSIFSALLRIAQVESGSKISNFTDVDLTKIFVDVVEMYEPLATVKGLRLDMVKSDPCHIQGDRDLLFQMLANLMDNAIKYTPEGGAIATSLSVENNKLTMIFADNGPGIPPEKYQKVFQRFYRVEESRGVYPGNGLGLSLVQAVVTLHGGKVSLGNSRTFFPDSKTPGLQIIIVIDLS